MKRINILIIIFFGFIFIQCNEEFNYNNLDVKIYEVLQDSLVAYYPFNGNANDESIYINNAIVHGATLTTNRFGDTNKAYYFHGKDNYLEVPHTSNIQPQSEISLCAWVYPMDFNKDRNQANDIIYKGYTDDDQGAYILRYEDYDDDNSVFTPVEVFTFQLNFRNVGRVGIGSISKIDLNSWYFVVGTYDGTNMKLYVNSILENTYKIVGDRQSNNKKLMIGRQDDNSYPYWVTGILDDIRIYNRALTDCEINTLYNMKE
ncbi:MAG: hypothetical protein A2X61_11800 [Ignavibacteria bacterium GWB2_35_12]|nr:MAG: hypothetical protein A2X61_11800 [Ignavibacteria bacterium GWB2_35_12]OGU96089.1 MAG: hypothetical protein A2220_14900 [Ignavibacteria bacterium RIFOXYA2_FULL_35_10]OGV24462.1 MAG: hypothetical protein A2475_12805 [Ignavibacteria bacterium RIFOXYC2_FULL_35_21]